jgi:hypothetical protein
LGVLHRVGMPKDNNKRKTEKEMMKNNRGESYWERL